MTPKEVIDGLLLIKEWEPRPFVRDICDAAIKYVEAYVQADVVRTVENVAEEVPGEDAAPEPDATETPAPETEPPAKSGRARK